jgi:hypothetical protein
MVKVNTLQVNNRDSPLHNLVSSLGVAEFKVGDAEAIAHGSKNESLGS